MLNRRTWVVLGILFGTVGCDQGTKVWASDALMGRSPIELLGGFVRLSYAQNTGGFGSLGATWPPLLKTLALIVLPIGFLAYMLWHAIRNPNTTRVGAIATALVVGGGFGNLIDRIWHGFVVDFMWFGYGRLGTNIFNVADVALMVGIGLILLDGWKKPPEQAAADSAVDAKPAENKAESVP